MTAPKNAAASNNKTEAPPAKAATKPQGQVQHTITPIKEPENMATKLTYADAVKRQADLKAEQDILAAIISEGKAAELKTLVNGWVLKAAQNDVTVQEFIDELKTHLPAKSAKKATTAKAARVPKADKVYKDWDSTKARPEVGKTYKHPTLNLTWTRKGEQGATKKEFIEAVTTGGKKWSELLVK